MTRIGENWVTFLVAGIDQHSKQYPLRMDAISAWLILTYHNYDLMPQSVLWTFKVFGKNSRNCRGLTLASKVSLPSITKSNPNFSHAPMQKRAFAVDLLRWLPFGYLHRISKSKVFHVLETSLKEGLASFLVPSIYCRGLEERCDDWSPSCYLGPDPTPQGRVLEG